MNNYLKGPRRAKEAEVIATESCANNSQPFTYQGGGASNSLRIKDLLTSTIQSVRAKHSVIRLSVLQRLKPECFAPTPNPELIKSAFLSTRRVVFSILALLPLAACGSLDSKKIAETIQQDVTKNGGTSLKGVDCPTGIKRETGKTFECVGEMDNGYTFTITVKQQDRQGNVVWDVPHAKGLLNLPKLEALIQEAAASEIGSRPSVSCGGVYKAITPGEGFECQLVYKVLKPASPASKKAKGKPSPPSKPIEVSQTEKISVNTDADGNVSWQRVLAGLATSPDVSSP